MINALILFYLVFLIVWIILWIKTLIRQAKKKKWVWFVFTVLIPLTLIVYWIMYLFKKRY